MIHIYFIVIKRTPFQHPNQETSQELYEPWISQNFAIFDITKPKKFFAFGEISYIESLQLGTNGKNPGNCMVGVIF